MKKIIYLLFMLFAFLYRIDIANAQADCSNPIIICGNTGTYNPSGVGNKLEQLACGGIEHNSVWFAFQAKANGKLNFVIRPYNLAGLPVVLDIDWSLYQLAGAPNNSNCNNKTQLSCNFSGSSTVFGIPGGTGMATPQFTASQFNPGINVTAGTWYAIHLDQFSNSTPTLISVQFTGNPETENVNSTAAIFDSRPNFTINTSNACSGSYSFTNSSTAVSGIASYLWDFGDGSSSTSANPTKTFATTGTYYVSLQVTDSNGCVSKIKKSVIYNNTPPTLTAPSIFVTPSCTNSNNGTLTVTTAGATTPGVSGGTAPYTYELVSPSPMIRPSQTSNVFSGLQSGGYFVKVTDACGKSAVSTVVTISQVATNSTIGLGIQNTQASCGNTATGAATIFVNGSTPPYTLALVTSSPVTTAALPAVQRDPITGTYYTTFTNLLPGNYTVEVIDGCGKMRRATFTVGASIAPLATAVASPSCAGTATGTLTITSTGSNGLTSNGSPGTFQYALLSPSPIIRPFQNGSVFENLLPGSYLAAVKDICGNIGTSTVTVGTGTAPTFGTSFTTPSCPNGSTGSIEVQLGSTAGGGSPYSFELIAPSPVLRPVQSDNLFSNLPPGTYTVRLKDACGTGNITTINVAAASAPTFTTTVANSCATAACGTITVTPGATSIGAYTFELISPGAAIRAPQGSNIANTFNSIFTGLNQGIYTIRMTDGCGVPVTAAATIGAPSALAFPTGSVAVASCASPSSGQLTIAQPNSGIAPYRYELISPSPVTRAPQYSRIFNGLASGSYTVRITDSCGTQVDNSATPITLGVATAPTLSVTNSASCASSTGTITCLATTANQGGGTYQYALIAPSPVTRVNQTSPFFSGLPAGAYTVQITDQCGLTGTVASTIAVAGAFTPAAGGSIASCNGGGYFGQLIVTNPQNFTTGGPIPVGSGGGPYTYALYNASNTTLITGPQSSNIFPTITPVAGSPSHTIRVTDGCGNTSTTTGTINVPTALLAATISATSPSCASSNTGVIKVTVQSTGGLPPLSYALLDAVNSSVVASNQTHTTFSNVPAKATGYLVRTTDACGNTVTSATALLFPAAVAPAASIVTTESCISASTGRIVVSPSVGATFAGGTFSYALYNAGNTSLIRAAQASPVFGNIAAASYTVRITDICGTTGTVAATVANTVPTLTVTGTPSGTCSGSNTGSIRTVTSGGSYPLSFSLVNQVTSAVVAGPQSDSIFTGLAAGTYIARVTDACGTIVNSTDIILSDFVTPPAISTTLALDCGGTAVFSGYGSGGNGGPFTYTLCSGAGCTSFGAYSSASTFTITSTNTYRISVKDRCGNAASSADILVTIPDKPVITSITKTNACGPTTVTVNYTNLANTPYYSVDGGNFSTSIGTLALGYHLIRVSNYNVGSFGCASDTVSVDVVSNVTPAISISTTSTSVCSGSNVVFTATASNGGPTPIYQWKVNGTNAGTNSSTFSSSSFANNDIVTCSLTANNPCQTLASAVSSPIQLTVNPLPTISLGTISSVTNTATTFSIPYTATTGSPNQYSITTGSPTAMPGFTSVTNASLLASPISVTIPASAANTYNFIATVRNSTTGCVSANNNFNLTVGTATTISTSGTLNAFTSCSGTASSQQSFNVSGSGLSANILVTPPTGFEVSTTSGSGFASSVTLTQSGGSVSSTTIYVRLTNAATGTPSGNITCVSTGATTQNVAASGTVNALPTVTLGAVTNVNSTATSFSLPYSATTGSPNQYSITVGSPIAMPSFSAVSNQSLTASPISVTIPASAANTYNFVATVRNSTTGCVSTNNNFTLTVASGTSITTTGTLSAFTTCAGTASTQQSFTVSGAGLSANILVTPPIGFEVSTTSGSGFASSVTLNQSGGSVSTTAIYVRLKSSATGTPSGNITCASTGATTQNVSASGTVNALPTITLGSNPSICNGTTSANLTYSATTGSPNQYNITWSAQAIMAGFDNVSFTSLPASPISLTVPSNPGAGTYSIITLKVKNSTTGCESIGSSPNVTVNALPTVTLGSVTNVNTTATSFSLPYSAASGSPDQYSITTGSPTAMPGFNAVNNQSLTTSPISVTIPASAANTYNFVANVKNSTTGCISTNNNFTLSVAEGTTISSIVKGTPNVAITNAGTVTYNITFGASITGLSSSNFSLTTSGVSGASIGILSGSGASYSLTVNTGTGSGSIALNLSSSTGISPGISTTLPYAGETYTIDKTVPTVVTQNFTLYLLASGVGTATAAQVNNGSSDASGILSLSINKTNFNCATTGANTVTLTVTDNAGNINTGTATITVLDTVRPVALTRNRTVYLNAAGTGTVTPGMVNNGSTDACGVAAFSLSKTNFNCTNVGTPVTVTFTVTDVNGNTGAGTATVTVLDTIRPVVVTQNRTVYLSAAGTATVSALQLNNGTSDACGVASLSASQTSYTCANVGTPVTVTLTATDLNGNTNTGTATVTVLDTIRPVVNTQNRTVYLSAAGTATVSALQLNNGTSDACGVASLSASQTSYTCANVGTPVTVTLTATDLNGNTNTGTATVTVLDTIRPVVVTQNRTVYLSAAGTATVSALQLNNGTSDACGVASLSASQTSYTCANVGTPVTVTLTATDLNGNTNTGTATVTVLDTIRPVVVTQNRTVYLSAAGTATVSALQLNNGTIDACGVASLSASQTSYTCANVGTPVTVTLTATDLNGNINTGTATVTVLDTIKPVVVTQNRTVYLSAAGTATVSALQLNNGTSDACGVASLSASQTSYTCANVGTPVTVTLTATDLNGNINTGTATVTVLDTIKPVVVTQNRTVYLSSGGTATVSALQLNNGTSDACGVASLSASQTSYTCANVGTPVTVTLTATDLNGNINTGTATVTVLDTISPTVVTQNRTIYLNASGAATVSAAQINNGSSDACGIASLSLSKTSFDCSNLGANTVTLTVTDNNSNLKTGTATVTVMDTIKPTVSTISGNVLYLNQTGTAPISVSMFNGGTADNCGVAGVTISPSTIGCGDLGIKTITLTVTDNAGNINTATTTAVVLDPVAPVARPKARVSIYLSANGQAVINPGLLDSASSDNCTITSRVLSQSVFNCSSIGVNNVTFTVQDQSGNSHAANVIVTVIDTIKPVATVSNQNLYLNTNGTVTLTAAQVNNNSTDNCGISSVSISKTSFDCSNLGPNTILFTAMDLNSNSNSVNVLVNVFDTIRPIVRPKSLVNVYLNASGTATLSALLADSASTDNCSLATRSLSQSTFTCANLGMNTVALIGLDGTGNEGSKAFTVMVLDTVKPNLTTKSATVYVGTNGLATLSASQVILGSSDNCSSSLTSSTNISSFTCANLGSNTVNVTVTDASNNFRTLSATVTVVDTIKPTIVTQNRTIYLNASGTASLTAAQVNNGSSDNCTLSSISISKTSFNAADLGLNTIVFTGTDNSNNSQTANVLITVLDTVRPIVTTQNRTIYLNAGGTATIAATQVNNGSTDNVGITGFLLSKTSFTCADLGVNQVVLTASDISNNSSTGTANITVLDTIKPVITAQNLTVYLNGIGQVSITPAQANNGSTDNCGINTLSLSKTTFTCNDRGANTVSLTASDVSNNSSSSNITVTVLDTIKPNVVVNNNLNLYLNASGTIALTTTQVNNGSTDNCGITSLTLSKTSFNGTNIGLNVVNFTATDASGNFSTVPVNVTIIDSMRPTVVTQNRTIYLNNVGTATITTSDINNGSSDNVGISNLSLSKTSFDCSNIGANTVVLTLTDASGNFASNQATVTVLDSIKPIVTVQNISVYLNSLGGVSITTAQVNNGSTDNCSIASMSLSKSNFTCSDKGLNNVNFTVTDASNNSRTVNVVVNVIDTIKPVLVTQNRTIYLNASGTATLTAAQVNNGSTDNCTISSISISKTNYTAADLGINNITFTATDNSSNSQSTNVIITVLDTTRPNVIVQNRTIYLNASGQASVTAAQVNNGSSDNVAITNLVLSKTDFTCSDLGANQVTLTASDFSNNSSTKNVLITVMDTIKPIANAQNLTVYLNAIGIAQISATQANNGSTDNCAVNGLNVSKTEFTCANRGNNTVNLTVSDASNNSSTISFTVNVLDTIRPNVVVNNNLNLYLDASGNVSLSTSQVNNSSTDNCAIASLNLSKTSFNGTNLGLNIVTFTATDASNNITTASINVNIIDTVRPILSAQNRTIYLGSNGVAFISAPEIDNGSSDNVGVTSLSISKTLFNCNETGTNFVEFIVGDVSGNKTSTIVTVTVLDTILPVVTSFPTDIVLGHCGSDYQFITPSASDNCSDVRIKQTSGVVNGLKYPVGITTNTFTFTDRSGNVVTRSFTVRILPAYLPDTFPNIAVCSSVPVFTLTKGNANVTMTGSGVTMDGLSFDPSLSGPGNHPITLTFIDSMGCPTKANFFVTVYRSPDKPMVERMNADVLQVVQTFDFYQWIRNGVDIPGANQRAYTMTRTGIYSVRVGTNQGCTTESDLLGVGVSLGVNGQVKQALEFNVFPNPTITTFTIDVINENGKDTEIEIFDGVGRLVYSEKLNGFTTNINSENWAGGTYYVKVKSDKKMGVKPLFIKK